MRLPPVPARRLPLGAVTVGALLLTVLLLLPMLLHPPVASTRLSAPLPPPGESAPVQVLLDEVSPAIARPGAPITVSGSIRNVGTEPVAAGSVRVGTTYRGLDTRGALTAWAGGELGVDIPRQLGVDELGAELVPGAQVSFEVRIPGDLVAPPFEFATLPLLVEVLDPDSPEPVRGQLRSYLPWDGRSGYRYTPIEVAWLVPVTLPADPGLTSPDPGTRQEAWRQAVGPGSPAATLVQELEDTSTTLLVDPAALLPLGPTDTLGEPPAEPPAPDPPVEPTVQPTEGQTQQPTTSPTASSTAGTTATPPDPSASTGPGSERVDDSTAPTGVPDLLDDPAQTTEPTGAPADPDPDPAGADPTVTLRAALAATDPELLWWLPTGDPDTAALLDLVVAPSDVAELIGRQIAADPSEDGETERQEQEQAAPPAESLLATGRRDVAWPVLSAVGDDEVAALQQVWSATGEATGELAAVVVPASSVQPPDALTPQAARAHPLGPVLLGYDEVLSGIAHGAGGAEQDGAAVQRLLAETLAIYQERPADQRALLLASPRGGQTDPGSLGALARSLQEAPWLRPVPAQELLAPAAGQGPPAPLGGTPPPLPASGDPTAYPWPQPSPLTAARIEEVEQVRDQLAGLAPILPGGDAAVRDWQAVLDQQYSARWRLAPDRWPIPVTAAAGVVAEVTGSLRIEPTTINLFADEGLIQITVVNELPVPVSDLQMTVTPRNGRLRVIEQPEPIAIGASSRATVQFRARAVAAGQVPVEATLRTPDGTPVGDAEVLLVRVQPAGAWIYWVLGGVAGVILVLGLARALGLARPAGRGAAASGSKETQ